MRIISIGRLIGTARVGGPGARAALACGFAFALAACAERAVVGPVDEVDLAVATESTDMTAVSPDDRPPSSECAEDRHCMMGKQCRDGRCVDREVPCLTDDECQNDTFCRCESGGHDAGVCVAGLCEPWSTAQPPYDVDCQGRSFSAGAFKPPAVKCSWVEGDVIMTPLVVDLNKDKRPEIVFSVYQQGMIVAIRGDNCKELWRVQLQLGGFENFAAADLDGDGFPELVVPNTSGRTLLVLDRNGKTLAQTGATEVGCCSAPAIADIDGQAPPEIALGGAVYRYKGGQLTQLWSQPAQGGTWGMASVWADMDGNGAPDLVTGTNVYDGRTGKDITPSSLQALGAPGGYPAIADFNKDGRPDIALVQSARSQQKFTIIDFARNRTIFGPHTVQGGGWGGAPTVGDYDRDGVPDVGFASQDNYYVYALKCARNPKPKDCSGVDPGVLWQRAIHDVSSGGTASSTFDFNGDGINEVVYRDECWFRVYNGPNGKTLFASPISSGTALEYPVIADVDNDGHADIVVPSDNVQGETCKGNPEGQLPEVWQTSTQGVFVLSDPTNRWMPSRALWHQHSYHITDIGDDYRVPAREMPNWKTWNNYRKNVQGTGGRAGSLADFTAGAVMGVDNGGLDCGVTVRLWANVCNRGTAIVEAGLPGTFYTTDPRMDASTALCTTTSTITLEPGQCESVYCDRQDPPATPQDLWFRVNDDGQEDALQLECKPLNDLLYLPQYECKTIG